jgi:hypothetical protein
MKMNAFRTFPLTIVFCLSLCGSLAYASTITGTVTNKTNGKPSAGDSVVLVDVQAGMADAATATTDAHGHYSLQSPGSGAYLIRVNHQGGNYFIAAPQGGGSGDISVYDVAAKLDGVSIDADMILPEAAGGMVRVQERYLVRNTSLPPRALFSSNTFEFVLPDNAVLDGASSTRPGGMATNTRPVPLAPKNHFTINVPIQPDQGEKETMFEVQYHLSYSGQLKFTPQPQMPADNLVVYLPKGMTFGSVKGAEFQPAQEDPRVQTFVAKNIHPGQNVEFTVSGEGQMPRDAQGGGAGQPASGGMGDTSSGETTNKPGGGIGNPIDTPDPMTKYKWWILGVLMLLFAAAAAFLLRKRGALATGVPVASPMRETEFKAVHFQSPAHPASPGIRPPAPAPADGASMLNVIKEELFSLERERISGEISATEYAEARAGLEAVLKRALKNG